MVDFFKSRHGVLDLFASKDGLLDFLILRDWVLDFSMSPSSTSLGEELEFCCECSLQVLIVAGDLDIVCTLLVEAELSVVWSQFSWEILRFP